ncbi:hypothetical protein ILYODFUR_030337 [Ilyodon furcidens]|uniref:Uncharacterized protein n=1 Tax=Ilyodon furcidens TaxID=33524 RepID=A0ABV0TCL2_9TELE
MQLYMVFKCCTYKDLKNAVESILCHCPAGRLTIRPSLKSFFQDSPALSSIHLSSASLFLMKKIIPQYDAATTMLHCDACRLNSYIFVMSEQSISFHMFASNFCATLCWSVALNPKIHSGFLLVTIKK